MGKLCSNEILHILCLLTTYTSPLGRPLSCGRGTEAVSLLWHNWTLAFIRLHLSLYSISSAQTNKQTSKTFWTNIPQSSHCAMPWFFVKHFFFKYKIHERRYSYILITELIKQFWEESCCKL